MTVAELIETLKAMPQDALVVQSSDAEGNKYSPVDEVSIGRYAAESTWCGEFGILEITEELRSEGFSEEDVPDGPPAVCLWPVN